MGKSFQTELDFRSSQPLESESSELATFLDLPEHSFRFDWTVAPMFQSLLACKKLSRSGFIIVKSMVYFYLSVSL